MSIVSPFKQPSGWDSLSLIVAIDGASTFFSWDKTPVEFSGDVSNDWDVKKAKGVDGATVKDKGYKAAKVTCSWLLWTPTHFADYADFVELAKPRIGRLPKPLLSVSHPVMTLYSLFNFRIEQIDFLGFEDVDQWTAKMSLVEYIPEPKPAKSPAVRERHFDFSKERREAARHEEETRQLARASLIGSGVNHVPRPSAVDPEPPLPSPWVGPAMNK